MVKYGTVARNYSSWCPEISPHSADYLDCFESEWHLKPSLWYLLKDLRPEIACDVCGNPKKPPVNIKWGAIKNYFHDKTLDMQRSKWLCGRVCPLRCVSHSRRPQPETLVHSGWSFWQRFCQTVIWSWKVKKSLTLAVFSMRLWLLTWTNNSAGQLSIFHRQDAGLAHGGFVHFHWRPSRNLRYVWLVVLFGRLVRCKTGVTAALSDTQRPLKQFPWTCLLQSTPAEAEWGPSHFTIDAKTHSKFQTLNESISCLNDAKFFRKRFWTVIFVLSWGRWYKWPGCLLNATLWRYSKHLIWPSSWAFMKWWRTWQKGRRTDLAQLAAWLRSESVLMDGSPHQTFIFGASRTWVEGD